VSSCEVIGHRFTDSGVCDACGIGGRVATTALDAAVDAAVAVERAACRIVALQYALKCMQSTPRDHDRAAAGERIAQLIEARGK